MKLATLLDGIATPERDAVLRDITLDSRDPDVGCHTLLVGLDPCACSTITPKGCHTL